MLNISIEEVGDITMIFLEGMLMRDTLRDAEEVWNEQLNKNPEIIAFNLKGLAQIDSISINHLFRLSKRAIEKDIEIIIYDINENIRKIFDVIKLTRVIPVMPRQKFENDYLKIS
jgi:anti-anti-sigma factor